MVNERGASRQQTRERREAFVVHGRRERRQMVGVPRQKKGPAVQTQARVNGGPEE